MMRNDSTLQIDLNSITLTSGSHETRNDGVCAMEAAAWLAGEVHSDHPRCVSPVIGTFLRSWNDGLPNDETRNQLLKPLLPIVLQTASNDDCERRRAYLAVDWLSRIYARAFLAMTESLRIHADALSQLSPLTDQVSCAAARPILAAARAAARDAAGAAARAAAGDAARAAAGDALALIVSRLQASASDLVSRMAAIQ